MVPLANSIAESLKEPKDIMKWEIAVKNKNSIKKFEALVQILGLGCYMSVGRPSP